MASENAELRRSAPPCFTGRITGEVARSQAGGVVSRCVRKKERKNYGPDALALGISP